MERTKAKELVRRLLCTTVLAVLPSVIVGAVAAPGLVPTECCVYTGCPDGAYNCATYWEQGWEEPLHCKKGSPNKCPSVE